MTWRAVSARQYLDVREVWSAQQRQAQRPGVLAAEERLEPGAYTRPLFGST
jgi:hypothetical protein